MKKFIKRLLISMIIIVVVLVSLLVVSGYREYQVALNNNPLTEKVNEIRNSDKYTTLNQISPYMRNAVVAIEDKRFYKHGAIDMIGLLRALSVNLITGDLRQGGSTLTQQLAKNFYFMKDESPTRKIAEAFMAKKLEKEYSKDEILELYLNTVYFGDNNYGIYDASVGYFNVYPSQLSLAQASMLAGLPQAPSVYALSKHDNRSYDRRRQVLTVMLKQKMITQEQFNNAINVIVY